MFIIEYQTPEKATGEVAAIYDFFVQKGSPVPEPLQLMSVSPGIQNLFFNQIKYFASHPVLSFPLLTAIRFQTAQAICFDHCTALNKTWLTKLGLSEEDIANLAEGRTIEAFTEAENTLLQVVAKVTRKEKITASEIQQLRGLGWKDSDIFDACAHATNMIGGSYLFEAFKQ
ncbi:MAG: hypothetical protein ABIJ50_00075 [Pseudomonadota bacterium]